MENLSDKTKKELADLAKDLDIKNYSKLSKPELIEFITKKIKKDKKPAAAKSVKTEVTSKVKTKIIAKPKPQAKVVVEKKPQIKRKDDFLDSEGYVEKRPSLSYM